MKKKYISLFLVILLGMIFNISNIKAYEETNEVIGQTKFVDKDGNINTVDVYDGTTNEEYNPYARTVSTANMVNFNCSKAKTTTNFTDYYTGQEGYLSKSNAADAAFLGYEKGKVKFMISGIVGLVDPQYVEVLSQGTYYASNYEVNSSGDLYHYISNNVNATGNQGNKNYIGTGPSYLTKNKEYYSYDGHYFYDNYNTMITDYKNNVRNNAVNPNNPYYSYFQYLPMRSQTTYTGSQISNYLNNKAGSTSKLYNTGDIFIKYQNKYGVNALMAASFAALESGWGKSKIALNKNNLFGLNATDNNPGGNADTFSTVDDCIMNFTSSWMSKRYLNPTYTSLFRGGYFGDKGSGIFGKYSSDPPHRVCPGGGHADAVDAVFLEENRLAEIAHGGGERAVGADGGAPAVSAQAEVLAPVFEVAEGAAVNFVEVLRAVVAVAAAPEAVAALADVVHVGHAARDADGDALVVRARGADAGEDEVVALRRAAGRAAEGVDDFFAVELVERQAGDAHAVVLREERRDAALTRQSDAGAGRGDLSPGVERGAVLAQDRGRAAAGVEPEGVVFGVLGG